MIIWLKKYDETSDPLIITVHPSITGADDAKLRAFSEFLDYMNETEGVVKPLPSITQQQGWIASLDVTGPSNATVGEEITINAEYTTTKYCPTYYFKVFGKYESESEAQRLGKHCNNMPDIGTYPFSVQVTIPQPPTEEDDKYIIRVVGRACHDDRPLDEKCDEPWTCPPSYDNFEAMDEIEINVTDYKLKLLFVPVNWAGTRDFDTVVNNSVNYFLNDIPLGSCRELVKINKTQNFVVQWPSEAYGILSEINSFVRDQGIDPADYANIIGLTETSPYSPVAGISSGGGTKTVWITTWTGIGWDDSGAAHEIGHTYSLEDEYCSIEAGSCDCRCNNRNWILGCRPFPIICKIPWLCGPDINFLDANLPCDCPPDGSNDSTGEPCCINCGLGCTGYSACCEGNKVNAAESDARCIIINCFNLKNP